MAERDEEIENLKSTIQNLESELASRSEQMAAPIAIELPEPATLLNRLKAKRKKSKCDLADVEAILSMLGSLSP
ncbi:flagellar alpha dynein [Microcoleus sp. F8-D3]